MMTALVRVMMATFLTVTNGQSDWGYTGQPGDGPTDWGDHYRECKGDKQSPIDILTDKLQFDRQLAPFDLRSYEVKRSDLKMTLFNNKGHTAKVTFKGNDLMSIKGGSLPHTYSLYKMHFHWGHDDTRGSEHTIDGRPAPMELHLVHKIDVHDHALKGGQGIVVLGFFFEISSTRNRAVDGIIRHFSNICTPGHQTVLPPFTLSDLLPLQDGRLRRYFRYVGSLTTPPCYESVIWTVAKDRIPISRDQLAKFRTLKDEANNPMGDLYRPTQPMNTRRVSTQPSIELQRQGESDAASPSRHVSHPALLLLSLAVVSMMFMSRY